MSYSFVLKSEVRQSFSEKQYFALITIYYSHTIIYCSYIPPEFSSLFFIFHSSLFSPHFFLILRQSGIGKKINWFSLLDFY